MTRRSRRRRVAGALVPWVLAALLFAGAWAAFRHVQTDSGRLDFPSTAAPAAPSAAPPKPTPALESRDPSGPLETTTARAPTTAMPTPLSDVGDADITELRRRRLPIPVEGIQAAMLVSTFHQARSHGEHEALDILAPRGTPATAVEDGTVAKLFTSVRGGLTIYLFDPSGVYCYYYAHLDRYADGLHDGQQVARGEVIGYVGTTGDAPPNTPHLHFAVFKLGPEKHWWQGTALDPYLIWR